jgi:phosphate transport system substrate-binding protein
LTVRATTYSLIILAVIGCTEKRAPRPDGGGATFIEPLMLKWQRVYERDTGVQIDYTGVGSGNGVQQMMHRSILFGCTDVPMTTDQLHRANETGGQVVHVPLALGGVVPIYRLAGISGDRPLRFSGRVLAEIFLGEITHWNDPSIGELNPGVKLPDQPIKVVSRSDPSGTTALWAEYLAEMRPALWAKHNMGRGMDAAFPVGVRQKGNPGVAGEVGRLDGAIGFVELAFARHMTHDVAIAAVRNRAGNYVRASPESVAAAGASLAEIPDDLCFSIVDAAGPDSYPVSGADWAVFYRRLPADRGRPFVAFLRWATSQEGGQRFAADLGYAPLPDRMIERIGRVLDSVEFE